MNEFDLDQLEERLEEKRAVLLSRVRVKDDADSSGVMNPDRSDRAQDFFLQERHAGLRIRLQETLHQVEAALQRLNDGSYGKCTRCGEQISTGRLEALPYAELCIQCQKLEEMQENYKY
ncbi:MAG: TraR/DksA family transcriptional regulator [Anaerolineales bacterium]